MSELSRLMLKAVRSLPPEEQDALLEAMLEPRLVPWAAPFGVTLPPLGPETGGPWQSVPVRLSTDQHERLKQWCQTHGFTMAVVLRGLVARFLDDQATRRPRATPPPGEAAGPGSGQAGTSSPAPGAPELGG
jgi:hypothetical protein